MTTVLSTAPAPTFLKTSGSRRAKNSLATVLVTGSFLLALIPLIWLLWTVISKGLKVILDSTWWTETQRNIGYQAPGGGALHAIVGTIEQVLL